MALHRLGQASHRVGEARSLVNRAGGHLTAGATESVGHGDCSTLVARGGEGCPRLDHRQSDIEVPAPDKAEDLADTPLHQQPTNRFGNLHSDISLCPMLVICVIFAN